MRSIANGHFGYLLILGISLVALLASDAGWRLAIFRYPAASLTAIATGIGFFLLWDIGGLALGIFSTNRHFVSGWHLVSVNMPVEELLFLAMLSYATLILYILTKPTR